MAIYYVQPNGSDSNTGLGPSNANAWRTVQKALGATGIGSGDTLYIAPGTYREAVTIAGTYSANTSIIGDRTASQFTGITPGYVRITALASDALNASTTFGGFTTNGKSYLTFDSIWFEFEITLAANTTNTTFIRCQLTTPYQPTPGVSEQAVITMTTTGQSNILFDKCYMQGAIIVNGTGASTGNRFNACLWEATVTGSQGSFDLQNTGSAGITMSNCTVWGASTQQIFRGYAGGVVNTLFVYNSLIVPSYCQPTFGCSVTNCIVQNWNAGYINVGGGALAGANTKQLYHRAFVHTPININPVDMTFAPYTPLASDSLIGAGSASFTYGTDFFGNPWSNPPSIGAMELKTYGTVTAYLPTERNASTITIVPASTSQSIELYLGATGLTFNTSGLTAYYIRNRSSPVQISLISQTSTGSWASGGFAEISSVNAPGVYRLDVPNAAFASGADDVTIIVRGAAGSNGAVVTCTLFNPTANFLNTQAGIYTASGTLGARLLQTVADNRPVIVTSANQIQVDAGQTFSSGSGTTILDPILNSVGRWTLEGSTLTLYNADGTYLRRCNLTQLGLSLSPT